MHFNEAQGCLSGQNFPPKPLSDIHPDPRSLSALDNVFSVMPPNLMTGSFD